MKEQIRVAASIKADIKKVWDCYTNPLHIVKWNFADPSWHCPSASNDMKVGGTYKARMEAKDGSFGFDFEAVYTHIEEGKSFAYDFGGRKAQVTFKSFGNATNVEICFDPEEQNPLELQQQGWQAILTNFKNYVENEN